MARQALIKLRRGTGLPANNVLAEGELAIDIAGKKLYSANSTGVAFTLSGDQYNLEQSGNASHGIITLTVDNTTLSNDSVIITGGTDVVVAGNSSLINVNVTSTLDTVLGRGNTSTSTIGVGNTTVTGFINVSSSANVGGIIEARANVTVNGQLIVANTADVGNTTVTGFINVSSTANVGGVLTARANVVVNGQLIVANTASLGNTTVTGFVNVSSTGAFGGAVTITDNTSSSSTSTGALKVTGGVGIGENLYVGGNLYVQGVTTQVSSTTVTIDDNLLKLAANQLGSNEDLVDAGWYMTFDVSNTQKYSGMIRDKNHANKAFVFFEGITTEPGTTVSYTSNNLAYIEAIIDGGTY